MEHFFDMVRSETANAKGNTILAFHVEDFCEFYGTHIKEAGDAAGLVVTKRAGLYMCGMPWREKGYIFSRMNLAGFSVVIYECDEAGKYNPTEMF